MSSLEDIAGGSGDKRSRIRFRRRDGAAFSMAELRFGLYEAAWKLALQANCRVKWATLYLEVVDQNGKEVRFGGGAGWTLDVHGPDSEGKPH
jgi:hypothetical protein